MLLFADENMLFGLILLGITGVIVKEEFEEIDIGEWLAGDFMGEMVVCGDKVISLLVKTDDVEAIDGEEDGFLTSTAALHLIKVVIDIQPSGNRTYTSDFRKWLMLSSRLSFRFPSKKQQRFLINIVSLRIFLEQIHILDSLNTKNMFPMIQKSEKLCCLFQ